MSQFFIASPGGTPSVPTQFTGNTGSGSPVANNFNILGSGGVATSVVGDTMTITLTQVVPGYVNVTTTPYVVGATDYFMSCDTSALAITVQLPNAPTQYDRFVIKDRTGNAAVNNITVTTVGGVVTIDGSTTYTFTDNYESVEVLFNGTSYESY